jgi:transporter family protein
MEAKWIVPTAVYILAVGGLGVLNKLALRTLDWQTLVLWTGIGYILVTAVLLLRGDTRVAVEGGTGWAILGAACAIGGLVAINVALTTGTASKVIPITAAYPALTLVLAAAVLSERVTLTHAGGCALIIAGVATIAVAK